MSEITREEYTKRFNEEAKKFRARSNSALNDEEMANAKGGVGGANEATCIHCGMPMVKKNSEFGDSMWYCSACNEYQMLSDAETIGMIKAIEDEYGSSYVRQYLGGYPVWWSTIRGLK